MTNSVELRTPVFSDKFLIFEWISNPNLQKMIGTKSAPTKESHDVWFENKLQDKDNVFKIITTNSTPVGIIGTNVIDRKNKVADIYIYVGDENYRRKGISKQALTILISLLSSKYGLRKITANIFSYNQPSISFFENFGFVSEGVKSNKVCLEGKYYSQFVYTYKINDTSFG